MHQFLFCDWGVGFAIEDEKFKKKGLLFCPSYLWILAGLVVVASIGFAVLQGRDGDSIGLEREKEAAN